MNFQHHLPKRALFRTKRFLIPRPLLFLAKQTKGHVTRWGFYCKLYFTLEEVTLDLLQPSTHFFGNNQQRNEINWEIEKHTSNQSEYTSFGGILSFPWSEPLLKSLIYLLDDLNQAPSNKPKYVEGRRPTMQLQKVANISILPATPTEMSSLFSKLIFKPDESSCFAFFYFNFQVFRKVLCVHVTTFLICHFLFFFFCPTLIFTGSLVQYAQMIYYLWEYRSQANWSLRQFLLRIRWDFIWEMRSLIIIYVLSQNSQKEILLTY